jgi:hypothetical protein
MKSEGLLEVPSFLERFHTAVYDGIVTPLSKNITEYAVCTATRGKRCSAPNIAW